MVFSCEELVMNKSTESLNLCIGGFPGDYVRIIWLDEKLYHICDTKPPEEELIPDHVCNSYTSFD